MTDDSIPVTVLSGTLGAGKTTTLNHVLRETDRDLAVLVNDMGEVNVDADRVAESSNIADEDEEVIELSNGCICCELRGDLLDAIGELVAADREFDAIVVESTGVAEPLPVAQTLTLGFDQTDLEPTEFYEETGIEPLSGCHLDTTVTVVDAHQFDAAMESDEILDDDGTEKHLGDLLVEQVEFCDVLVLNKCDLVSEARLEAIESTLEVLQPRAQLLRTEHGRVDPDAILETGRFDFEDASRSAGWIRELEQSHESAEDEHGVTSFVFEARRPFHPERFADLLDDFPDAVVRAKGHFWLAGSEDEQRESSGERTKTGGPVSREDEQRESSGKRTGTGGPVSREDEQRESSGERTKTGGPVSREDEQRESSGKRTGTGGPVSREDEQGKSSGERTRTGGPVSREDEQGESSGERTGMGGPVSREDEALTFNVAGQSIRVGPGGQWVAALPPAEREQHIAEDPDLEAVWHDRWGDRNVRLVVIGVEMDHDSLRDTLEECLLSDDELEADRAGWEDRFPTFEYADEGVGTDADDDPGEPEEADVETEAESEPRDEQAEIGLAD